MWKAERTWPGPTTCAVVGAPALLRPSGVSGLIPLEQWGNRLRVVSVYTHVKDNGSARQRSPTNTGSMCFRGRGTSLCLPKNNGYGLSSDSGF